MLRAPSADLVIREPVRTAEWDACVDLIRAVCYHEGWREVDELVADWIVPRRVAVRYASSAVADVMGVVVLADARFPIQDLAGAWPDLRMSGARPAEIVLLVVKRVCRAAGVNLALVREVERIARDRGITDLYAILDDRRLALYRKFGIDFREVPGEHGGGRHVFWGEECFPVHLCRAEAVEHLRAHAPETWRIVGG